MKSNDLLSKCDKLVKRTVGLDLIAGAMRPAQV